MGRHIDLAFDSIQIHSRNTCLSIANNWRVEEIIRNKQIQKIFDPQLFATSVKLFREKCNMVNSASIQTFLDYFESQWCAYAQNGWFEGYAPGLPSTSNALESVHEKIMKALDKKRLGLIPFLNVSRANIIKEWTVERSPTLVLQDSSTSEVRNVENLNQKVFNHHPIIAKSDLVEAYKWNNQNKTIIHFKDDNYYYVSSCDKYDISKDDCKSYNQALNGKKWSNFDEMMNQIYSIHRVKYDENDWTLISCTCWFWLKRYKCHRQIAIAARKKKCNFDSVGMDIPIQSNRKKEDQKKH